MYNFNKFVNFFISFKLKWNKNSDLYGIIYITFKRDKLIK